MINDDDILAELRQAVNACKGRPWTWAKENGVNGEQVSAIYKGKRPMEPKIAEALGYHAIRMWIKND